MRRPFITVLIISFALSTLTGCHPAFQGTLNNRDGNGQGPTVPAGQAQIISTSPNSAVAATASFTMTVNELNFLPTTTVLWDDNTSLATTYVSPTTLQAQVPTSLLPRPTSVTIVPSPLLSFNFGSLFTITAPTLNTTSNFSVSKVSVEANDIAWNQTGQQFYLSVASRNSTNPNTITTMNPQTSLLGSSVSTGSEPDVVAVSTDGAYIYTGLKSTGTIRRYTLPGLQFDLSVPLGTSTSGPYYAVDIQPQPGNAHTVAVARGMAATGSRGVGGILIYDDATARPQSIPALHPGPGPIDSLVWNPNAQSLYGADNETGSSFYIMSVSPLGVQLQTQTTPAGSSFGNHLHFDSVTGNIFSDFGKVIAPSSGAIVGSFPLNALQGGFNRSTVMVPDGLLNIAYFIGQTVDAVNAGDYVIEAFDLTHFNLLGAIPVKNVSGTPIKIIRWGSDGLAFLTVDPTGAFTSGHGVYLVSGSFVTSPSH